MKKVVKYLLITVAGLILLSIIAAVALTLIIDPNEYKGVVADMVKKQTGRTLTFQGDLSLSFFPWIGVDTQGLSLSNAPGFGDKPFVSLKEAQVRVKVWPLIFGDIEVSRVVLRDLALDLAINKQGVSNWDDLAKGGEAKEEKKAPSKEDGGMDMGSISVEGVSINNANVVFNDMPAGKRYEVRDFNLDTDKLGLGSPFSLRLSTMVFSSDPEAEVLIKLSGKVHPDVAAKRYVVNNLDMLVDAKGKALPVDGVMVDLDAAQAEYDMAENTYGVSGLMVVLKALGGDLPVESLKATLQARGLKGDLKGQSHSLADLELGLEGRGAKLPGNATSAQAKGSWLSVDLANGNATIRELVLSCYEAEIFVDAVARDITSAPKATGRVRVSPFNPKLAMERLGLKPVETADPKALTSLAAAFDFAYAPDRAKLANATVNLDETTIKAWADVADMKATPEYAFDVDVDTLNVDRYLPPAGKKEAKPKEKAESGKKEEQAGLPFDELRKLDLDGKVAVGELVVKKVKAEDVLLKVLAKNGVLRVEPFSLKMYDGSVAVHSKVDASGKVPSEALTAKISKVQTGPLLTALAGKDWLSGKLDLDANLATRGSDEPAMTKNLNGDVSFKVKDGGVKGLDLLGVVSDALAQAQGKGSGLNREKHTAFATLYGSAKIKNGVVHSGDMVLDSTLLVVKGRGDVDLPKKKINFVLETEVQTAAQQLLGRQTGSLLNLSIPVYIKGDLDDPSIGPDMKEFVLILAKKGVHTVGGVIGGAVGGVEALGRAVFGGGKGTNATEEKKDGKPEPEPGMLLKGLDKLF